MTASPAPLVADRYEVIRPLRQVAFGRTLLARDLRLDRLVTLKVLHPERERLEGVRAVRAGGFGSWRTRRGIGSSRRGRLARRCSPDQTGAGAPPRRRLWSRPRSHRGLEGR